MSLVFHLAMPPVCLVLLFLWVGGGLWCERRIPARHGSLTMDAVTFVGFIIWSMGLIAAIVLFGGSLLGLFFKLFIEA